MRHIHAFALLLSLAACSTPGDMTRVEDRLLMSLPVERLAPVRIALEQKDIADDVVAGARRHERAAAKTLGLARAELATAIHGVERERVTLERSRRVGPGRAGNHERLRLAGFAYDDALQTAAIARLAVALAKRELVVTELRTWLAREEAILADARVQCAKGFALDGTSTTPEAAVPLADLREQVAHHEREVRGAHRRLSAARVEMQFARDAFDITVTSARLAAGR